jgi:hypothetical protein
MRILMLTPLAYVVAVGTARAQGGNAGPPFTTWEQQEADSGGRTVYVRNNTKQPITIEAVIINRCENIRQTCGEHPANLLVPPGKTVVAFRIERFNKREGWSWSYTLRPKRDPVSMVVGPAQTVTMTAPAGTMVDPNGSRSTVLSISVDSFHAVVPAFTSGAACGNIRVPDLPEGHKALLMIFGTPDRPVARRVMVRYDANGNAYDFNDTRRDPVTDSAETSISLDLVRQTGFLRNSPGGGRPPEWFRVTGARLVHAESLGWPDSMSARVLRECGK